MTMQSATASVPAWTTADRLRKAREHSGLTQRQIAERIGVSRRSISSYETVGTAKRPVLLSWALATGVPLAWLKDGAGADLTPTGGSHTGPKVSRHLELLPTIEPVLSAPCGVLALAS